MTRLRLGKISDETWAELTQPSSIRFSKFGLVVEPKGFINANDVFQELVCKCRSDRPGQSDELFRIYVVDRGVVSYNNITSTLTSETLSSMGVPDFDILYTYAAAAGDTIRFTTPTAVPEPSSFLFSACLVLHSAVFASGPTGIRHRTGLNRVRDRAEACSHFAFVCETQKKGDFC